ncbi:GNAT family N-acetyltransferase [Streptomyces scopuliridis]|uniref:GNAT family N-acetyltransferase n=1 Tax=Streptomyces scopuliridis TaxID=452529 RepID=UPI002DDAF4D8|nr:GNAT family N-acetyltransferase [Streptomyces scopuliridis]WSB36176.1 GNAT family N-acetyltransferase [Streptomyces scopuliridis]
MTSISTAVIDTERLALLPLRVAYAEEMAAVLADRALYAYTGGTPPTVEELRSRYARQVAGSPDPEVVWCNWMIGIRKEAHATRRSADSAEPFAGSLAGYVQATIGPDGDGQVAEIAWVVGTARQGRGIATEAVRGLVRWLKEQGVRTLVAHIHPDHGASAAVAKAVGLAPTGERHDGEVRWRWTAGQRPAVGACADRV